MSFSVMLQQLAGGMLVSIEIFFVTLLFSLPLGLLICFGRMSKKKMIRRIVSAYRFPDRIRSRRYHSRPIDVLRASDRRSRIVRKRCRWKLLHRIL